MHLGKIFLSIVDEGKWYSLDILKITKRNIFAFIWYITAKSMFYKIDLRSCELCVKVAFLHNVWNHILHYLFQI